MERRFRVETEDGEFLTFEGETASTTPTGILDVLDKNSEVVAMFASDQWLAVYRLKPAVQES